MSNKSFFNRINYSGAPSKLASQICMDYGIGQIQRFTIPPMGYEDLNIVLGTPEGTYFTKIFASFRSESGAKRYVTTMETVLNAHVAHPFLYQAPEGGNLHQIPADTGNDPLWMVLMQYLDGGTVLESGRPLTVAERCHLIHQTAMINSLDYKPAEFVHDSWAITSFLAEFEIKRVALSTDEELLIGRIADRFGKVQLPDLPSAFVHGDIRRSNLMRTSDGGLHIIDFAVANWQPRIVELAVLLSDLFFNPADPEITNWVINEYQRYLKLTTAELDYLPLFVQAGHAMNVMGASYEKALGNTLEENNEWLKRGRMGLGLDLGAY